MAKSSNRVNESSNIDRLVVRHLRIGWCGLLVFLALGIILEAFHGLKLDLYLDVRNQTRRFMWTLCHTHGTLFSIVHIVFATSLSQLSRLASTQFKIASLGLTSGWLLMPAGFFLGGLWFYGGDPGLGIFLVPLGGLCLLIGVGSIATATIRTNK